MNIPTPEEVQEIRRRVVAEQEGKPNRGYGWRPGGALKNSIEDTTALLALIDEKAKWAADVAKYDAAISADKLARDLAAYAPREE